MDAVARRTVHASDESGSGASHEARQLEVLVLCDNHVSHAGTLHAHLDAFSRYSRHSVTLYNPCWIADDPGLDIGQYDVLVLHWSLVATLESYLSRSMREKIAAFPGLKVHFVQDEHRWVDDMASTMRALGIDVVYTVVPPSEVPKLYGERVPAAEVVHTLTGFVPDDLVGLDVPRPGDRPIDIGYRGRELPFWGGLRTYEKVEIGRLVLEQATKRGLRCDIAWTEDARIYGDSWIAFLASCKAVLGTPSGASIADYDGSVERAVREHLERDPDASFAEVHAAVLEPYEGTIDVDVISPRIFEAAATRTALVLFPGRYSDLIEPEVHYLRLERDLSNFDSVVQALRDDDVVTVMTDRAYADLIESGRFSLRAFIAEFDRLLDRRGRKRTTSPPRPLVQPRPATERRPLAALARGAARRALGLARRR